MALYLPPDSTNLYKLLHIHSSSTSIHLTIPTLNLSSPIHSISLYKEQTERGTRGRAPKRDLQLKELSVGRTTGRQQTKPIQNKHRSKGKTERKPQQLPPHHPPVPTSHRHPSAPPTQAEQPRSSTITGHNPTESPATILSPAQPQRNYNLSNPCIEPNSLTPL